jgi:hypothetical protein
LDVVAAQFPGVGVTVERQAGIRAPPNGPTFTFGEYILSYQDWRECHGRHLTGGVPGQIGPLGPDLNLVKQ